MKITNLLQTAVLGATLIAATSGTASAGRFGGGGAHVGGGGAISHASPGRMAGSFGGGHSGGSVVHGGGSYGGHGGGVVHGGGGYVRGGGYGYGGRGYYGGGGGYWRGGVWIEPSVGVGYACDPYYDDCVEPAYVAPRVVVRAPIAYRHGYRRW
jgi:hypothetical protein